MRPQKPSDNDKNYVDVQSLDDIKQEARIEIISDMIIAGKSKNAIISELSKKWNASRKTISTIFNTALLSLQDEVRMSKEQARDLSNIRTESVWGECNTVKQKVSVLDLFNKLNGLYVNEVKVDAGDNTFKFEIGVDTEPEELSYEEEHDAKAEAGN